MKAIQLKKRKGQVTLNDAPMLIILVVVAVVVLTVMTTVVQKIQTSQDEFESFTTTNESITPLVNISQSLDGESPRQKGFAVVELVNGSNGFTITSGNYTFVDAADGTATFTLVAMEYNNTALKITYTNDHSISPHAYNVSQKGLEANKTISDFFDPITVVVAAVIIIGLILGAFVFARRGSGGAGV